MTLSVTFKVAMNLKPPFLTLFFDFVMRARRCSTFASPWESQF